MVVGEVICLRWYRNKKIIILAVFSVQRLSLSLLFFSALGHCSLNGRRSWGWSLTWLRRSLGLGKSVAGLCIVAFMTFHPRRPTPN